MGVNRYISLGLVRLPIAWLGAAVLGTVGLWIAFPISNLAGGIVAYLWFKRGTWREQTLTDSNVGADIAGTETSSMDD